MNRRRMAGFALVAAAAMSVLAVSGALGSWKGESNPTYATGSQITHNGKSFIRYTTDKFEFLCEETTLTGEFAKEVEKLTLNPVYGKCRTEGGVAKPVTIAPNGCSWTFYGGKATEENKSHFTGGKFGLDCPAGQSLEVHIYANSLEHSKGNVLCTVTVVPQDPGAGFGGEVTFTNTAGPPADVDLTTETSEAVVIVDGPMATCGLKQEQLKITGGLTVKGYSDAAHTKQVNIEVL